MFILLSLCVPKKENQGLYENQQKKMGYKLGKCANQPQSHLKIKFSWNNPYLAWFYLGIQVGSTKLNKVFRLPPNFVTWENKVTSIKKICNILSKIYSYSQKPCCKFFSTILLFWHSAIVEFFFFLIWDPKNHCFVIGPIG